MYFYIKKSASGKTLQLLESYRNSENRPRHRVVASLGDIVIEHSKQSQIANEVESQLYGQCNLNLGLSKDILYWVDRIIKQVDRQGKWKPLLLNSSSKRSSKKNKNIEIKEGEVIDGVLIDQVNHTHTTSVGPELLGFHAWNQLELSEVLKNLGFNEVECKRAATSVISRLVSPSSENFLLKHLERSGFPDLFGEEILRGSKDRFYKVSDKLLKNKNSIEIHLRDREKEYFHLNRTILLYDLTNTHFEGSCLKNLKAKYGKNKQKRNDCPQVVVGMVFDENGFELAHDTFSGNLNDSKSLLQIVQHMKAITNKDMELFDKKSLVIIDAGIATKNNLKLLRKEGFHYLVNDSRRGRLKYADEFKKEGFEVIKGRNKKPPVEVRSIEEIFFEEEEDSKIFKKGIKEKLILCRSSSRKEKENAMLSQAEQRFVEDLNKLSQRIEKGKLKDPNKIQRAIGKKLSRHPRVARFYSVTYKADKKNKTPFLKYTRNDEAFQTNEALLGCYVLRSDQMELCESELWQLYMTLTRAEDGFQALKSDLGLRPNFHQITSRVDGHIFITVLAYHLLQFILYTLTETGDNRSWFTIKKILQTHCYTTMILPTKTGKTYRLRKVGVAEQCQREIYEKFNINIKNLPQTKTVVKKIDFVVTHENDPC